MKLQKITLKNFRGVRGPESLALKNRQSLLLYGENGTGKSSFADAVEWFITNNVSYLSGEEIERYGGLRNALSKQTDECFVEIDFTPDKKGKKTLNYEKEKLNAQFLDQSSADLANLFQNERFLLRNKELVSFILATKTGRLLEISRIIGFDDVVNAKEVFKKAFYNIKSVLDFRAFESQIASKKKLILEKLQATVNTREQFFSTIDARITIFNLGFRVQDKHSLTKAQQFLKAGTDEKELKLKNTLELCNKGIGDQLAKISVLHQQVASLINEIADLKKNQENIKQISLSRLLDEAEKILNFHEKDECPLCQQQISRETLLTLIGERILALKQTQNKLKTVQDSKENLLSVLREIYQNLKSQLNTLKQLSIDGLDLQPSLNKLSIIEAVGKELNKDVLVIEINKLRLDETWQRAFEELRTKIVTIIHSQKTGDSSQKVDLLTHISVCEVAFDEIEWLEKEKAVIEEQRTTLEKILSSFIAVQRDEMKSFLKSINAQVNEYFIFMNHGKKIDTIELSTVDKSDGEFAGISIQLKFHGQPVSSAKKYLSESYLNCLGLCIFLASMKLFNTKSKFFILDDVISSFDKAHRVRFGQLLLEKFSDFQILVLTHESEWFDFMASTVKGSGWKITQSRWNAEEGTFLEAPSGELKEQIRERIEANNESGLGNLLRRYAERMFKELCFDLEGEVKFRFNDHNEKRMLDELFSTLRGRLKEKSDLSDAATVKRLSTSKFITNQASHDSSYKENIDDLKAVYDDLSDFDGLFRCNSECKQRVSTSNMNRAKKTISCKCGDKEINWKD